VEKHPSEWIARAELADVLLRNGEYKTAASQFARVLTQQPNNAFAMNNLAWAYFNLKDSRALATAEAAYRIAPKDVNIMDTFGWILVQSGQLERGLKLLEHAVAAAPKNPEIRFHRASALAKSGKKELARSELSALAKDQSFEHAGEAADLLMSLE
jgi:Flp pilus assembly protein TadD